MLLSLLGSLEELFDLDGVSNQIDPVLTGPAER